MSFRPLAAIVMLTLAPAFAWPAFAEDVPATTVLHARLRQLISSFGSRPDTRISSTLIAPVEIDGKTLLPLGSELLGHVDGVRRVGLGLSRETAFVELSFDTVRIPEESGETRDLAIDARVLGLDNAREIVDARGRIHGIRATASFSDILSGLAFSAGAVDPMLLGFTASSSLSIFRIPESEVILPPGTELTLHLLRPVAITSVRHRPLAPDIDGADAGDSSLAQFVRGLPYRTATEKTAIPSDITNLLFLGSQPAVANAFSAAGWGATDPLSARSSYAALRAIVENQGYREAPMSVLLLDQRPPVFTYAKTLDTFFKRHHARVFGQVGTFRNLPVWTGSSTHDSGIGLATKAKSFIHVIDENIDEEREKIVYDFVLTGCVDAIGYVDRPWIPQGARNATGDLLRTDTRLAVLRLNACEAPERADVEASAGPAVRDVPGPVEKTFRNVSLWVKNDFFRGNIIYQGYAGARMGIRALTRSDTPPADRTIHVAGEEFKVVPGASAAEHPLAPDDPGEAPPSFQPVTARERPREGPLLEFSFSGGDAGFGNDEFSTQRLDLAVPQPLPGVDLSLDARSELRGRAGFAVRTTFNAGRFVSHEVGYSLSKLELVVSFAGSSADPPAVSAPAWQRQFSYNVLVHARPPGSRVRPYVAAGPALSLIRVSDGLSSHGPSLRVHFRSTRLIERTWNAGVGPPLEGGGILQPAFQYGAGIKYYVSPRWLLRADFRETLSSQPDFWTESYDTIRSRSDADAVRFEPGPLTLHGPLRSRQLTGGIGVAF